LLTKKDIRRKTNQEIDRKPLRLLICTILGFVLLSMAIFVFLHLPQIQKQLIGKVVRPVEKAARVEIELESYRWSSFSQIHLTSLQVRSDEKEFLRCEQAQLSYRLSTQWPYLIPEVLLLDRPVLHLERDSRGKWRIPRSGGVQKVHVSSHGKTRRWMNFPLPEVQVNSGRIVAVQEGQEILSLQNVTGSFSFKVTPGDDGPILSINLGQWQGINDFSSWLGFSGVGAAK